MYERGDEFGAFTDSGHFIGIYTSMAMARAAIWEAHVAGAGVPAAGLVDELRAA